MAITKIHPIKATVNKAIKYVANPDKTDEFALVDTFGCGLDTAAMLFESTIKYAKNKKENGNKAFHLIQSFVPGETTPEEAHRIGLELCDKLLGGKYSFVIGTHQDKHHIHNHIIFCAVDNIDHKKYHDCRESYRNIMNISDKLCHDHGLDVIGEEKEPVAVKKYIYCKEWKDGKPIEITTEDLDEARANARYCYRKEVGFTEELIEAQGNEKYQERASRDWAFFHAIIEYQTPKEKAYESSAKSYKEWLEEKNGTSWKKQLKDDINATIKTSKTYEDFIEQMKAKGYHIKGEKLDGSEGKYISYLCPGQDPDTGRWIRGKKTSSKRGLGEDFSRERIKERIDKRAKARADRIRTLQEGSKNISLIDTSSEKFQNSPGLTNWAEKENLSRMSRLYMEMQKMGYSSREALADRIATIEQNRKDINAEVEEIERKLKNFGDVIRVVSQYEQNKKYFSAYQRSKDPERYLESRLSEITLFQEAEKILKNANLDPARVSVPKLREEYSRLETRKAEIKGQLRRENAEEKKLDKYLADLNAYVSGDRRPDTLRDNKTTL